MDAVDHERVRTGAVVTLGELFMRLGKEFSCKKIYAFFRALRPVALKRDKAATSKAPGSASAKLKALGTSGGPLQAASIKSEFRKEHALVAEYIDLKGLSADYVRDEGPERILKEAINSKAAPLPLLFF